jgi:broad specificity phosphatase PhoE
MLQTIFLAYFTSSFREIYCLLYQQQYTVSRPTKTIFLNGLKFRNHLDVVSTRLVCTRNGIFHKSSIRYCTSDANSQQKESEQEESHQPLNINQRRSFLISIAAPLAATTLVCQNQEPAFARGLVQFPCKKEKLQNTYHFMRSGQSLLEERDILSTNPLFLTNRENALSDLGIEQVEEACRYIKAQEGTPTIVGYSLAANCVDSAAVVGKELRLGQNRLVPEFTFLDPRAVGKWDILPLQTTEEAIWAMDTTEAGDYGSDGRPPPNDDGTPNETLGDQVIRLRQYFSGKFIYHLYRFFKRPSEFIVHESRLSPIWLLFFLFLWFSL